MSFLGPPAPSSIAAGGRAGLLGAINAGGFKLKKTSTVDKSAPVAEKSSGNLSASSSGGAAPPRPAPAGLGGLFAGGELFCS